MAESPRRRSSRKHPYKEVDSNSLLRKALLNTVQGDSSRRGSVSVQMNQSEGVLSASRRSGYGSTISSANNTVAGIAKARAEFFKESQVTPKTIMRELVNLQNKNQSANPMDQINVVDASEIMTRQSSKERGKSTMQTRLSAVRRKSSNNSNGGKENEPSVTLEEDSTPVIFEPESITNKRGILVRKSRHPLSKNGNANSGLKQSIDHEGRSEEKESSNSMSDDSVPVLGDQETLTNNVAESLLLKEIV